MYEKFIGEVKGIYNTITLIDLCISLLCVIIGVILSANPSMGNQTASIILGVIFIANGVSSIFSFIKRGSIKLYNLNIIYGSFMIVLGILSLIFLNVLQVILGIYFIFLGVQKATYGLLLNRFSEQSWLLTVVVGVLFLTMGIISFFSENVIAMAGIVFIGYGVINIVNVILLRKRSKYYIA